MKKPYLLLFALFLLTAGCSSTYTIGDFISKQKFFESYNGFAKEKNVKIILTSDSAFYSNNMTEIDNDTLYVLNKVTVKREFKILSNEIKSIHYMDAGYKTANILLENGERIKAENIIAFSDSMKFLGAKEQFVKSILSPIDKVKAISYKNHWLGLPVGLVSGGIVGGLIGAGFIDTYSGQNDNSTGKQFQERNGLGTIIGIGAGIAIGTAVAWFVGYNYTYQFNP